MKPLWTVLLASSLLAQSVLATNGPELSNGSIYGMGGVGRNSEGQSIGTSGGIFGFRRDITKNADIDLMYYNEGTSPNNHRDGFAAMGWYNKPVTQQLSVQAGAGPYVSMNTTTNMQGEQLNDKRLGALVGLAAMYHIYGSKFYLTTRYTHAVVPGAVGTDTLFVGAGYYYDEAVPENWADPKFDINVMGGNSQTTRANNKLAHGFQIEVRRLNTDHVAYSVSVIQEGDTNIADRTGVAAQVWYVVPTADDKWTFSVGAGPYVAQDKKLGNRTQLMGVGSMEVARKISKTSKVSLRFTRAISGNDKDQDMFFVGIQKEFK